MFISHATPEMSLILKEKERPSMGMDLIGSAIHVCAEVPTNFIEGTSYQTENALEVGSLVLVRNAP